MVSEAQRSRAKIQKLADQVSNFFVPGVIFISVLTFGIWMLFGPEPPFAFALVNAVSVLVIACPCALGLATPMAIMVGMGRGAQAGVLIRNAEALEVLDRVDTLVVDKTGTLTEGKPKLVSLIPFSGFDFNQVLQFAAKLEKGSEHPLAQSILAEARKRGIAYYDTLQDFQVLPGQGVLGEVQSQKVQLGKGPWIRSFVQDEDAFEQSEIRASDLRQEGQTVLFMAIDGKIAGLIGVADPIKETTFKALKLLKNQGICIVLLTGDHPNTALSVAKKLGIEEFEAEVSPQQKCRVIQKLQSEGRIVAMAGDGINDAPALALAHVGIAMATGTDIAMQSAAVTLLKGDLLGIVKAKKLSRATIRNIRQNLFFAFIYNAAGIPVAAGLFYPIFGILLSPMFASLAMSLSSVCVILNALRLRKLKLKI
jgi:Cu+-exporting ATPase